MVASTQAFMIKHDTDKYLSLGISEDKMTATIHIGDCDEFYALSVQSLKDFLDKTQIRFGVKMEALQLISEKPQALKNNSLIIAEGLPVIMGEDGYIKFKSESTGVEQRPLELDDGSVNYKELTQINNVRKGELLATRVLATQGMDGKNVHSDPVQTKPGKEVKFKLGKNVVQDAEQMKLYSVIDGVMTRTEKDKINVFPIYEVKGNIDYRSGNIDFVGTVVIQGNVLAGFKVKAAGDVRVQGNVEGCEIEAGGAVEVSGGVIMSNKGMVKAGTDIRANFVQDANIYAAEDIVIKQSIMHSQVRSGKRIICNGQKGLIVGGMVQAGDRIVCRVVGNQNNTPTMIEVGVHPELRNELNNIKNEFKNNHTKLENTMKALILLDRMATLGKLPADKLDMYSKLTLSRKQVIEEMNMLDERKAEIELILDAAESAKVDVMQTVFGGTKVGIGRYTRNISDTTSKPSFRLKEGEITITTAR